MTKNCDMKRTRRTQGSLGQEPSPVFHQTCVPPTHFLIANSELESPVSPIRINELKFPNRKFLAIFHVAFQTCALCLPASTSTASPSSIRRPAPSFRNPWPPWRLIETPRLEFLATPTKQYPSVDSNRDKNGVLSFAFRGATSGATLTLQAPRSNLPASCFVRAPLGEHS
jgi:hypothetical protein